jgi:hypothetical protein
MEPRAGLVVDMCGKLVRGGSRRRAVAMASKRLPTQETPRRVAAERSSYSVIDQLLTQSGRRDSNPRPPEPHGRAEPVTLRHKARYQRRTRCRLRSFSTRQSSHEGRNGSTNGSQLSAVHSVVSHSLRTPRAGGSPAAPSGADLYHPTGVGPPPLVLYRFLRVFCEVNLRTSSSSFFRPVAFLFFLSSHRPITRIF